MHPKYIKDLQDSTTRKKSKIKKKNSVVLIHKVCGNFLHQPQEVNTGHSMLSVGSEMEELAGQVDT